MWNSPIQVRGARRTIEPLTRPAPEADRRFATLGHRWRPPATRSSRALRAPAMLERLADETFDVLVVGGGITGAGVALDAATRGLRTALVEAGDFASGTSSKSSKLVHGGLRYLQQGDVRLVYEALHERQRLRRNAPHLVKLLPFMIPILTKDGLIPRRVARALGSAMWMYDVTGGARIGKLHKRLDGRRAPSRHLPTMRARAARRRLPLLRRHHRRRPPGPDGRAHRGRARRGRRQPLPCRRRHQGRRRPGRRGDGRHRRRAHRRARATVVVNAAGVWADEVRTLEDGVDPDSIRPAKGVHITVPWEKVRNDIAVVIPVPRRQAQPVRRAVGRAARRHVRPHLRRHDRHRLRRPARRPAVHGRRHRLRAARPQRRGHDRHHRPTTSPACGPGCGRWSSRPTSGRTADLSRRHRVTIGPAGVVAVTGGKLTTYREMAEDTVDVVIGRLGRKARSPHQAPAARRRATATSRRPTARPTSTSASATAPWPAEVTRARRRRPDARRAARRRSAVPARRGRLRRPPRDGDDARRRAHPAHPGAPVRSRGHRSPRPPTSPRCSRAELGWDDAEVARQVDEYGELVATEVRWQHHSDAERTAATR